MKIRRILVGIDFSEHAHRAAQEAAKIARDRNADLVLVHVVEMPEPSFDFDATEHGRDHDVHSLTSRRMDAERKRLLRLCDQLSTGGVKATANLHQGSAPSCLETIAKELAADLVVVGHRGCTPHDGIKLGGVAERISRRAPTSILVVRETDHQPLGFRNLLVATDFSGSSVRALEMAELVADPDASFDLVNCWRAPGWISRNEVSRSGPDDVAMAVEVIERQTRKKGAAWLAQHGSDEAEMNAHLVLEPPVQGIADWLEEHHNDLVVVGSRGHGSKHRRAIGSVAAATVLHAPCSVLVVR